MSPESGSDMDDILYIHDCLVCGERTGFTENVPGSCDPCTPHICTRELPEDTWCDICGKDL